MNSISFSYEKSQNFFTEEELTQKEPFISQAHKMLHQQSGPGNDCLGWLHLPTQYRARDLKTIEDVAQKIKSHSDILLVIGVGGSYLGSRAAIEMLTHTFHHILPKQAQKHPTVLFVGHHLSSTYMKDLIDLLEIYDFSINVISKSGMTKEPAIAFRIFEKLLIKKYGKEKAKNRIFVTTSKKHGALKSIAEKNSYKTFHIPENIGGRYSVLTAVGLLPMAVSGINIEQVINGAAKATTHLKTDKLFENDAYQYAILRNILYDKGKTVELLVSYEPHLKYFSEWWKQLFAESEGKHQRGIYPASVQFTTDLHSVGQYIQDGKRQLFETTIYIEQARRSLSLTSRAEDVDQLNYLSGQTIELINEKAFEGAVEAHVEGQVPNLIIRMPELTEFYVGYLFYFFQKACAMSAYLQGINPFDQPGVESYKQNMTRLLKKFK